MRCNDLAIRILIKDKQFSKKIILKYTSTLNLVYNSHID